MNSHYRGRKALIASMHGKETVIAPVLSERLGLLCEVISDFNTDQFGTFSGEIERIKPPLETLRMKVEAAHAITGADLIIGSEGSFGPHPMFFMLPANEEFILMKDYTEGREFLGRHLSEDTNHSGEEIHSMDQFRKFCDRVGFPSHGIILKLGDQPFILKDLTVSEAEEKVEESIGNGIIVHVETDMRANRNPTRMNSIAQAAGQMAGKILSLCPECNSPGFWISKAETGLPCRICGSATKSVKSYLYVCQQCNYSEDRPNLSKQFEDPMYCDFCNP